MDGEKVCLECFACLCMFFSQPFLATLPWLVHLVGKQKALLLGFDSCAVEELCFPADATIRRINKAIGGWERVTVAQLAIGDSVECLKGTDSGNGSFSALTPGVCDIYYYIEARKVCMYDVQPEDNLPARA